MRCAIVIPVYNHEATIAEVVRQSLDFDFPVFVVDDGSTDASCERIPDSASVTILRHAQNRGKGAALLTGFAAAALVADWAVTLDADGQHRPEDIPQLLAVVPEGMRPIVVGRREGMQAEHVPRSSRFGRKFSNFWVQSAGGPHVADTQSGMRLYPLPETLSLPVRARRFQFEVEVLVKACWYGVPVLEAPVEVIYAPKGNRISHYRGFVDFMRNSAAFTRLIFGRIFMLPFIRFRQKICKVKT
jgi:glycosyltransferase involved in cell wall biosynthesis